MKLKLKERRREEQEFELLTMMELEQAVGLIVQMSLFPMTNSFHLHPF